MGKFSKNKKKDLAPEPASSDDELNFDHLPQDEAAILRNQIKVDAPKISYFTLYRYATTKDTLWLLLAHLLAIAAGAAIPMYTLIFGSLTDNFTQFFLGNVSKHEFQSLVNNKTLYFLYLGIASLGLNFLKTYIILEVAEVITARTRRHYLQAVLRQNIAYFDKLGAGEVTTRITNDTHNIQQGIAEKATQIVSGVACFIAAFAIAFSKHWKMTLIMFSVVGAILLDMMGCSTFIMKFTQRANEAYSEGSSVVEETLSSIRNTTAFGVQSRLAQKFDIKLLKTRAMSGKRNLAETILVSFIWGISYFSYALGFWQGSRYVASGDLTAGTLITVVMSILVGAFIFGNVAPALQHIGIAMASGTKVFETIDRVPPIDSSSSEGVTLGEVKGSIEFRNVKFIYPSRPEIMVLPNLCLTVNPGETVALVGASGSGKSTIIGLTERFYEPVQGQVFIDGHDISTFNLRWLRQQIALVSQEPTLFSTTLEENILYGLVGAPCEHADAEIKRNLVIEACKTANAWDFICELPDGLATQVGERGFLLSGGQKQRIAIARAMISQPKILLLDEATSALDAKSEGVVQEALERAAKSRTTIVIAHRLSTIKDADKIVVMSKGEIVEAGTHEELLGIKGVYHGLVEAQSLNSSQDDPLEDASDDDILLSNDSDIPVPYTEKKDAVNVLEKVLTSKSLKSLQSASSQIIKTQGTRYQKPTTKRSSISAIIFLLSLNTRKDNIKTFIGIFLTSFTGFGYPALGMIYAYLLGNLMVGPEGYAHMRERVNFLSGMMFMVGVIIIILYFILLSLLSDASLNLCRRIRLRVFKHYLRMDIAYFDLEENNSGALVSTLAKDAESVLGLSGSSLCQVLQSTVIVIGGFVVGLAYNWRMALVCFSTVPLLVACGFVRFWVLIHLEERSKSVYESSGSYACESVGAVRTVASLTREEGVVEVYRDQIDTQVRGSKLAFFRSSLLMGLSEGLVTLIMGLGFWYGATLMTNGEIDGTSFFVVFFCIIFGANGAGNVFSFAGDMGKAKHAADNIANILGVEPNLDPESKDGISLDDDIVEGSIEFVDVHFRYPTRHDIPVLRGLNLSVKKGQYIALVGSSGCGKSTTIGLIERFYEPLSGSVLLDGQEISSLNIKEYRNQIALVQQEPTLYSGSIRENILYGLKVNHTEEESFALKEQEGTAGAAATTLSNSNSNSNSTTTKTETLMIDAAIKANIHDFVMSLPDGYDTFVGSKGSMLSGGQKQRIAIARALVRNPKVLLLDEATSALDSESEKVVQAALDAAAKGRTTIAVAHRLSTIQNADRIYVFEKGRVLESGTHLELLANKSKYYELVQMQRLQQ